MFVHHRRMDDSSQTRFCRSVLLLVIALAAGPVAAEEINVPDDESTIQEAIDAAVDGDVILVDPGEYEENITLQGKNRITLSGKETARTIIKPANSANPTVTIDDAPRTRIKNFTFLKSDTGISITTSPGFSITSNVFHLESTGVALTVSSDSDGDITNNTFYKNSIGIKRAANTTWIENNLFANNGTAISDSSTNSININYNGYYSNTSDGELGEYDITVSDPAFVSISNDDFHLTSQSTSAINTGKYTDSTYDNSVADLGAFGGADADTYYYPVANLRVLDDGTSYDALSYSVILQWSDNTDYRVSGYNLYTYVEGVGTEFNRSAPVDVFDVTNYTVEGDAPVTRAPAAPAITSITPRNQTLIVAWTAVSGATSYELRYGVDNTDENILPVGNVTSFTLAGLSNGTEYKIRIHAIAQATLHAIVKAHDRFIHESYEDSSEVTQVIGPAYTSNPSEQLPGTPEATVSYPLLPNEGCFIATAAYGHYSAPQVQALRDFRDQYLLQFSAGRSFVHWYYTHGPAGARVLNEHPVLKLPVRVALYPLVLGALFFTQTPAWMQFLTVLALFLFSSIVIHRYRKRTPCAGMPH